MPEGLGFHRQQKPATFPPEKKHSWCHLPKGTRQDFLGHVLTGSLLHPLKPEAKLGRPKYFCCVTFRDKA
jgi:hypothetical protein